MRIITALLVSLFAVGTVCATTLERLGIDQLVEKSTLIVRARVTDSVAVQRGSVIYTTYKVQVIERLKGQPTTTLEVAVPGGSLGRFRQSFAGTPSLAAGSEYVIFVWTGSRGMNHVLGLSQGLFDVRTAGGETVLTRGAIDADFLDSQGRQVSDPGAQIPLRELVEKIRKAEK